MVEGWSLSVSLTAQECFRTVLAHDGLEIAFVGTAFVQPGALQKELAFGELTRVSHGVCGRVVS